MESLHTPRELGAISADAAPALYGPQAAVTEPQASFEVVPPGLTQVQRRKLSFTVPAHVRTASSTAAQSRPGVLASGEHDPASIPADQPLSTSDLLASGSPLHGSPQLGGFSATVAGDQRRTASRVSGGARPRPTAVRSGGFTTPSALASVDKTADTLRQGSEAWESGIHAGAGQASGTEPGSGMTMAARKQMATTRNKPTVLHVSESSGLTSTAPVALRVAERMRRANETTQLPGTTTLSPGMTGSKSRGQAGAVAESSVYSSFSAAAARTQDASRMRVLVGDRLNALRVSDEDLKFRWGLRPAEIEALRAEQQAARDRRHAALAMKTATDETAGAKEIEAAARAKRQRLEAMERAEIARWRDQMKWIEAGHAEASELGSKWVDPYDSWEAHRSKMQHEQWQNGVYLPINTALTAAISSLDAGKLNASRRAAMEQYLQASAYDRVQRDSTATAASGMRMQDLIREDSGLAKILAVHSRMSEQRGPGGGAVAIRMPKLRDPMKATLERARADARAAAERDPVAAAALTSDSFRQTLPATEWHPAALKGSHAARDAKTTGDGLLAQSHPVMRQLAASGQRAADDARKVVLGDAYRPLPSTPPHRRDQPAQASLGASQALSASVRPGTPQRGSFVALGRGTGSPVAGTAVLGSAGAAQALSAHVKPGTPPTAPNRRLRGELAQRVTQTAAGGGAASAVHTHTALPGAAEKPGKRLIATSASTSSLRGAGAQALMSPVRQRAALGTSTTAGNFSSDVAAALTTKAPPVKPRFGRAYNSAWTAQRGGTGAGAAIHSPGDAGAQIRTGAHMAMATRQSPI